jgi:hypothetical protein
VIRGLFLYGPAAAAVGGCERKVRFSGFLSDDINLVVGTGGPAVAVEMACFRDTTQSSARNGKI